MPVTEPLFVSRVPSAPLSDAVESVWFFRQPAGPHTLERILPTGTAQLIINLSEDRTRAYGAEPPYPVTVNPGTVLAGVSSKCAVIDSAETTYVAGVSFRAGGLPAFFRLPPEETRDIDIPLEALWGRAVTGELRDRLLETRSPQAVLDTLHEVLLRQRLDRATHPAVILALDVFRREPRLARIDEVSRTAGLSQKRFIERFTRAVGVTPKRFCRLQRFQQTTMRIHRGVAINWAQLALECGYFDQAHFNHEFREFAGLTPTRYLAQRGPFQNHVKILQSDEGRGLGG